MVVPNVIFDPERWKPRTHGPGTTASRHDPISRYAVMAFSPVVALIPEDVPIILEPLIDEGQSDIETEIQRVLDTFALVMA